LFDRKQPAGIWPVLINPADRGAIIILFQEWTFENQLAARSTSITLAAPQCQRSNRLLLSEVGVDEPSNLSLGLSGAQSGV
jgi:hypothetical protein